MSFATTQNPRKNEKRPQVEAIIPKNGILPITLEQLSGIRLKQLPPSGVKVVMVFSGDGNTQIGVTEEDIKTTSIHDVRKVNAARAMAQMVLGNQKKKELESTLVKSVLATVGPIAPASVVPTHSCVQEMRRVIMEYDRLVANAGNIKRVSSTGTFEINCKKYLINQFESAIDALRAHMIIHMTGGDTEKSALAFSQALLDAGVPRALYAKLVQPNLVDDLQMRLDYLIFGSKIQKGLRLTYEELNSHVISNGFLFQCLQIRNKYTLAAARSLKLYNVMIAGLSEADIKKLRRNQFLMVSPGNISQNWASPHPMPPIPYGGIGEIILKINQLEVNYHSGVVSVGTRLSTYWSGQVTAAKYADDNPAAIAQRVLEDAKTAPADVNGFTIFPRDTNAQYTAYVCRKAFDDYFNKVTIPFEDVKVENPLNPDDPESKEEVIPAPAAVVVPVGTPLLFLDFPVRPYVNMQLYNPHSDPKNFLESEPGKTWSREIIARLFLKTSDDVEKVKKTGNSVPNSALPRSLLNEVKLMSLKPQIHARLISYLMQFQSVSLMKRAFDVFNAELQKMEIDGTWVGPDVPSDEEDDM